MTIQYDLLASELTTLTGKLFILRNNSLGRYSYIDYRPEDYKMTLCLEEDKDKIKVNLAIYYQDFHYCINEYATEDWTSPDAAMGASVSKGEVAIAKDIQRRLLNYWLTAAPRAVERFLNHKEKLDERTALCQKLAGLCGRVLETRSEYGGAVQFVDTFFPHGQIYKVYVGSDLKVDMELRNLTPDQATIITEMLSPLKEIESRDLYSYSDAIIYSGYQPSPERLEELKQEYIKLGGTEDVTGLTPKEIAQLYRKRIKANILAGVEIE